MIDATIDGILQELAQRPGEVMLLLQKYREACFDAAWLHDARLHRAFGRRMIGVGQITSAFELVREGALHHAHDRELQFLSALAMVRGGNLSKGDEYVAELLDYDDLTLEQRTDGLALAGRIKKDRYRLRKTGDRSRLAQESARLYQTAFQLNNKSFQAINYATMSLLAGQPMEQVQSRAQTALKAATRECGAGPTKDYWLMATLGEAHLLLGQLDQAEDWYRQALQQAAGQLSDVATMRRQVQLIEERLPEAARILALFAAGAVVIFVGHMIDAPDRKTPRFPLSAALEERVRGAIAAELDRLDPAVGYCCGACGSDLLFAEELLRRNKELHIVLPYAKNDFYTTSVDFGMPEMQEHRRRFDAVLERAELHYGTEESYLGDEGLFEFVNDFMQGLGIVRAAELDAQLIALALLDPASRAQRGGTRHFLDTWNEQGRTQHTIDLAALREEVRPPPHVWSGPPRPAALAKAPTATREIKVMLFADVKNYSVLTDLQAPAFFTEFLGEVGGVIQSMRRYPALCNTWGDGLFMVFHSVLEAADFSTRLLARIEGMDFTKVGLPSDTTVRIGLHAGPVYPQWDRLIGRLNFFGTHVNRAARIEPKTPPGCIYTSEQFAALLATAPNHSYCCEYMGVHSLGKEHDKFRCRLYRLHSLDE